MNKTRIVITGMGAVTPIGIGIKNYWQNLIKGISGVKRITRFDVTNLPVKIGAEIKDFDPLNFMSKKLAKETALFTQYAYAATEEALTEANLPEEDYGYRTGIVMGTAMSGIAEIAQTQHEYSMGIHTKVSPRFVPKILGNIAPAQIAIAKGIKGPSYTITTACSSGGDAISTAAMLLKAGEADTMVVAGGEAALCPITLSSLAQAQALSRQEENPETVSRPFDANRSGFVMGEGGGALVLETLEHALKRGAKIIAELAGYANNNDAYHITSPNPEGESAAACMAKALDNANLNPDDINYINAHGTSTHMGDICETKAIKRVFGSSIPLVSSTKSATGHMMGAGGVTEVITCVCSILNGIVPPTINLTNQDPECDLDYVPNQARKTKVRAAMSNAFGFGGQNSTIIVKEYV